MKQIVFILFITVSLLLQAQTSIKGKVVDVIDENPIQFTTIKLFDADSNLVAGGTTDEQGVFFLDQLKPGNYSLSARFIGYQIADQSIELKGKSGLLDLGAIQLKRADELNAVEIMAEAPVFESRIDKKIFNAEQNIASKGGTAIDVLRQVPTITIDENDNILLRGDGNVTILIDGRPIAMPANQLLPQIPASSVETVEIITNPSAKYDPEGMSGIINITLKKEERSGFNGNVDATFGYGDFPKYRGSVGLNYRNNYLNISASYNYNWRKIWFGGNQQRDVLLGDTLWDRLRQNDYGERINTSNNAQLGIDYFINDYNTIYASGNINLGTNLGSRDVFYNNVGESEELLYHSERRGRINAPSTNYTINGGWQKSFKKEGHTLDLDYNLANTAMTADEDLTHDYFNGSDNLYLTDYQNTYEDQSFSTMISKLDYVLPITDSMTFEAGFHYTRRFSGNDFTFSSSTDGLNFVVDTNRTNNFHYLQQTFAPYVTFALQIKKFGIKGGLRLEQTITDSELITTKEKFENDYLQLFPSLHLSYQFDPTTEIQLSYSRRINRPEMYQLNPFSNYSDPLTLQTGNPFLQPEFIHVNELSFMKYWKKFNINATAYFRLITNLIRRNLEYNDIYSEVSFANLNNSALSGGDLTLTFMPIKGLRIISSTSIWNTSTRDDALTGGELKHYTGLNTSLMAMYQLKSGWRFQYWGSYQMPMNVIQGTVLSNYGMGFGIQKSFFNRKLNVNIAVMDIMRSRRFAFQSYDLGNYTFDNERRWESRRVSLSISYRFGKQIEGKSRRQNNSGDSSDDLDVPQMQ